MSNLDIKATQLAKKQQRIRNDWPDIDNYNGVFVFPYEIRSGFLNKTEVGYIETDEDIDSYSFFQKLITGKENINVIWKDSTKLVKPKGKNEYVFNFKVGEYYIGAIVGNNLNKEVQFYDDDLNHKNIKLNNTVVLHFVYNTENSYSRLFPEAAPFITSKKDLFCLYRIPQLFGNEWMYITNINYETMPETNKIVGCFVSFASLNEQLSASGEILEGFIHENTPNEPYAKPKLTYEADESGRVVPTIKLDDETIHLQKKQVKYIQIEIFGANALTAINIIGREIKEREIEGKNEIYFGAWKFLYPSKFYPPKIYDLEKTNSPSINFFVFPFCSIDFTKSVAWIDQWRKASDVVATNNFTGVLHIGEASDWNDFDHKSNKKSELGVFYEYYSEQWKPFTEINVDSLFDLSRGAVYCTETLKYDIRDTFLDILIKNSFIYRFQLELPLSFSCSKPYRLSDIPIIGGMFPAIFGDRTINPNLTRTNNIPICCIVDCAAATCGANILIGSGDGLKGKNIPLSFFGGEDVPKYLGVETCNTSLCFSLTKWMVDKDGKEWDTVYLGEKINEKDEELLPNGQPFLYDGTQKTTLEGDETFVIDKIMIQGLIKGKIKITFFSQYWLKKEDSNKKNNENEKPLWTTTVQSKAKYTNSLRNWTTEINVGCWDWKYIEKEVKGDNFTWPTKPVYSINDTEVDRTKIITKTKELPFVKQSFSHSQHDYIKIANASDVRLNDKNFIYYIKEHHGDDSFVPWSFFPLELRINNFDDFKNKIDKIRFSCEGSIFFQSNKTRDTNSTSLTEGKTRRNTYDFSTKKMKVNDYYDNALYFGIFDYDYPYGDNEKIKGYNFAYRSVDYNNAWDEGDNYSKGWFISCKNIWLNDPTLWRKLGMEINGRLKYKVKEDGILFYFAHEIIFYELFDEKNLYHSSNMEGFAIALFYRHGNINGGYLDMDLKMNQIDFIPKKII